MMRLTVAGLVALAAALDVEFAPVVPVGAPWSAAQAALGASGVAAVREALVSSLGVYPTIAADFAAVAEFLRLTTWFPGRTVVVVNGRLIVDERFLASAKNARFASLLRSAMDLRDIPNVAFNFEAGASGPPARHECGAAGAGDYVEDREIAERRADDAPFHDRYGLPSPGRAASRLPGIREIRFDASAPERIFKEKNPLPPGVKKIYGEPEEPAPPGGPHETARFRRASASSRRGELSREFWKNSKGYPFNQRPDAAQVAGPRDRQARGLRQVRDPRPELCGIPTDSRYLQLECSGTNFWGLPL
jgi:hypothetical protein